MLLTLQCLPLLYSAIEIFQWMERPSMLSYLGETSTVKSAKMGEGWRLDEEEELGKDVSKIPLLFQIICFGCLGN